MRCGLIFGLVVVACTSAAHADDIVKYIPGASSADGRYGTSWSTDLWITSHAVDGVITVYASFVNEDGVVGDEVAIEVAPGGPPGSASSWRPVARFPDAVSQLFGREASGAIRLRCEHPFEAWSRTSTGAAGGVGSFGLAVPAVAVEDMTPPDGPPPDTWAFLGASHKPGADGVRTNIGFVNPSSDPDSFYVDVYDGDGVTSRFVGRGYVIVEGGGWVQRDLFTLIGAAQDAVENAWVVVGGFHGALYPYLTRIDNATGDAVFIEPFHPFYYRIEPRHFRVEYTLDLEDGATAEWLEYAPSAGEIVRIENPPDGWSRRGDFWSFEVYLARAQTGPHGGTLTFSVTATVNGVEVLRSRKGFSYLEGGFICQTDGWLP
jgi:hypothetical protein